MSTIIPTDIEAALLDWYTVEEARVFLASPQQQLGGKTAMQAIADGEAEKVLAIFARLNAGAYL